RWPAGGRRCSWARPPRSPRHGSPAGSGAGSSPARCRSTCLSSVSFWRHSSGIIGLILRHTFSPPDNTRMAHLCGPLDAHLRAIEAALEVKVAHRFEQFRVEGPKAKAQRAMEVVQALYEMARGPIPPEQVQLMLSGDTALAEPGDGALAMQTRRGEVRGRTPNQAAYLESMAAHDITFGIGPAGTGKTYLAVACAVDALERSAVQRIVLTRPAVEA